MATDLGQLSEDAKLFMKLLKSERYYALNNRTINLLLKAQIDMSVVVGEELVNTSFSDVELVTLTAEETDVEIFVLDKNKTRAGGAFFPYINNTVFDF